MYRAFFELEYLIVAKKKFIDGLESLFGGPSVEEKFQDNPLLTDSGAAEIQQGKETAGNKKEKKKASKRQRRVGKSFTSDLDSLFEEALQENLQEQVGENVADSVEVKVAKPHQSVQRRRPVMGLDVLIRRTSDVSREELMTNSFQKRITFVYEKKKVAKLKAIAKAKKLYMKDIIGKAVTKWLKEYEAQNGKILD